MYDPHNSEHRASALGLFRLWDRSHEGATGLLFSRLGGRLQLHTDSAHLGRPRRLHPVTRRALYRDTLTAACVYARSVFGPRDTWPLQFSVQRPEPALVWVLVYCQSCPAGHYRPSKGLDNGRWECRCGHVVTRRSLADGTGDVFRTEGGALQRGTPDTAEYLVHYPSEQRDRDRGVFRPRLLTLPELLRHLREHCVWSSSEIGRTVDRANVRGEAEHVSGHGLRTRIRRLT